MSDLIKVASLWKNERDGKVTLSGPFGSGARLILMKNQYKREDKHPDYVVFLAPAERRNQGDSQGQEQGADQAQRQYSDPKDYTSPPPVDDIPF